MQTRILFQLLSFMSLCALALILQALVGHDIITAIYKAESLPLLNKLINNQAYNPLSYYHALAMRTIISFFVFGCGALTFLHFGDRIEKIAHSHFRKIAGCLYALFCLYACLVFFRPESISYPIIQYDYAFHYTGSIEVAQHILNRFHVWGYNPFMASGMLSFNVNDIWSGIFQFLFLWLHQPALIFNVSVFISIITAPLLALAAAIHLGMRRLDTLCFFSLAILLTFGFAPIRAFYFFGSYGFNIAVWLCLYLIALTHSYLKYPKRWKIALLAFLGIAAIFIHPLSAVVFIILFCGYCFEERKLFQAKKIFALAISAIIVLCASLSWIVPIIASAKHGSAIHAENLQTYWGLIAQTFAGDRPFLLILLLTLYSLFLKYRWRDMRFLSASCITLPLLFIISFSGTQLGLGSLEPSRFIIPLAIACALPVCSLFSGAISRRNRIYIWGSVALCVFLVRTPLSYQFGYGPNSAVSGIIGFLDNAEPKNGRILIQTARYGAPYCESHIPAYISHSTGFETTANIYAPWLPNFQSFVDDKVFGRPLAEFSADTFLIYLEMYNIKYILVYDTAISAALGPMPFLSQVFSIDNFVIFDNKMNAGRSAVKSEAIVRADFDCLTVTKSSGPETILKYHYFPGMKVKPDSLTLRPKHCAGDPVPFVSVLNRGCPDFTVSF